MKRDSTASATDAICSGFTGLLLLFTLAFPARIPGWRSHAAQFAIAFVLYTAVSWALRRLRDSWTAVVLRTAALIGLLSFLFGAMAGLQHVLVSGWMDGELLGFERALTGVNPAYWLQRFVSPVVTEIMMFAYVIYVPALPGVALLCYRAGGARAANEYLLHLSAVNVACNIGFVLFPVASPMFYDPRLYTVPLKGWFFTWCGDWIRHHAHYAGGSLPSPHCAASSIMLVMLYRYDRRAFRVALPVVLILYVSTVYCRFHYASDAVAGILTAVAVTTLFRRLRKGPSDESSCD